MKDVIIAWFRQDLRIQDNPVLAAAAASGAAVLPLFIDAPKEVGDWQAGGASRWWLHHALAGLQAQLGGHGLPLLIRRGSSADVLTSVVQSLREAGHTVATVMAGRLYEPALADRDAGVRSALEKSGVDFRLYNAGLLIEPEQVRNRSGDPFRVFTPFWKHLRTLPLQGPIEVDVAALQPPGHVPESLSIEELALLPEIPWDAGFAAHWDPSPDGAASRLAAFAEGPVRDYKRCRDRPDVDGTSRLSPYLHCGQIGPRQVWAAVHATGAQDCDGGFTFLSELAWREFAHHLLHYFPDTTHRPLYRKYENFPWEKDEAALKVWQQGRTGYPFVDAGMRQLWRTGWMHNRVRMVVGSFLVKHLLQPWQDGARWFWDTLVDADLANNTLGWQWVAGCGADASPWFRIFNPFTQGEKFDPRGNYVRTYVPELAALPDKYIHRPWEAPDDVLKGAGIELGKTYPQPFIDHRAGRERALAALRKTRG